MFDHASHNRAYALVWNEEQQAWVPAPERSRARGQRSGGRAITAMMGLLASAAAHALDPAAHPTGGNVVAGQAQITQAGNLTTINQASARAVIDWQGFNIGSQSGVDFVQPSSSSVALNRVLGQDPTQILGSLHANGQVFLVNPNGVLFGAGAQVSAAGILASTRDVADADFMAGRTTFSGSGTGTVVNQGSLAAAPGGYVALIGAQVVNSGRIAAPGGDVRLAAADQVTLRIDGAGMASFAIDRGTLDGLVANQGAIRADGGRIFLTAEALDTLSKSLVNNTGLIEAQTVGNDHGTIVLGGDMAVGTVSVGGTLDASAPNGGDGGNIETSAAHVDLHALPRVTTLAASGKAGNWLIDPTDYTVASTGGDLTGADLGALLQNSPITLRTTDGASGTQGNIDIDDTVSWSANKLTLNAANGIVVNADMTATGSATLALEYGQGAPAAGNTSTFTVTPGAKVNLPDGNTFSTKQGSDGATLNYTVISQLGSQGSSTQADLQGIAGNVNGLYALGADIDASSTSTWNGNTGFGSIWSFAGKLEGLGHTITALSSTPSANFSGLFAFISTGSVSNLTLSDVVTSGSQAIGGLAGQSNGTIFNVHVTSDNGSSAAGAGYVGLLVGINNGTITQSSANGTASGNEVNASEIGGLVGHNTGTITQSSANATVSGTERVGGLVGYSTGNLSDVTATAVVTASGAQAGGIVGWSEGGNIDSATSHGSVTLTGREMAGGIVGKFTTGGNPTATISNSSSDADVTGNAVAGIASVGGLAGYAQGAIVGSSASGTVSASGQAVGGLVGSSDATITSSSASGHVTGDQSVGGLVGVADNTITGSYASGAVSGGSAASQAGGLAGAASGAIVDSHATGTVDGNNEVGGLVGELYGSGSISGNSYAQGNVGSVSAAYLVGGLVGRMDTGTTLTSTHSGSGAAATASGSVHASVGIVGGLVGYLAGASIDGATASGDVSSAGDKIGGLVGAAENNGGTASIDHSSASGIVTGTGNGSPGSQYVGGLVGYAEGTISNSSASGAVTSTGDHVGGLVGLSPATIGSSSASGAVIGDSFVGGLVGEGTDITGSHASGAVLANGANGNRAGGLAGNVNGAIVDSYATGTVDGGSELGGLVGHMDSPARISGDSYAQGAVGSIAGMSAVGGLVGATDHGAVIASTHNGTGANATATGAVTGTGDLVGGLVGNLSGATVDHASASGDVTGGGNDVGGLVGRAVDDSGPSVIDNSSASGAVHGTATYGSNDVGGLAGYVDNTSSVTGSHATGAVTSGGQAIGGLVGQADGAVDSSSASGNVSGGSWVGGLVGRASSVTSSSASGDVSTDSQGSVGGGLVGMLGASLTGSFAIGHVDGGDALGGLVGYMLGGASIGGASYATGLVGSVGAGNSVGGLVGHADPYTRITSTYAGPTASGAVTATGNEVGGLVGTALGTVITNVSATGNVASSGTQYVGGLVGRMSSGNGTASSIDGSSAAGTVQGTRTGGQGTFAVGGLVGWTDGDIGNSSASGAVSSSGDLVGGLVGQGYGAISGSSASGSVAGANAIGGLVGMAFGAISSSSASGAVTAQGGSFGAGGLVGQGINTIVDSHATGAVDGGTAVGGLVGELGGSGSGAISGDSYASGVVGALGAGSRVGGLVGQSDGGASITSTHAGATASGNVTGTGSMVGGLVGWATGTSISGVSASGNVSGSGTSAVGGLVGQFDIDGVHAAVIAGASATGSVQGTRTAGSGTAGVGGLVGISSGSIDSSLASGNVTATGDGVGGLVGSNFGNGHASIASSSASGNVQGRDDVGGLVGSSYNGGAGDPGFDAGSDVHTLSNVSSSGSVTGRSAVGGLVGYNNAAIDGTADVVSTTSTVTATGSAVGGFVGRNDHDGSIFSLATTLAVNATGGGTGIGGVVGENEGAVANVHAANAVHSDGTAVGGVVGLNVGSSNSGNGLFGDGAVVYSDATGSVDGVNDVGGLVGRNDGGLVGIAYAAGTVNGSTAVGGLIGSQTAGTNPGTSGTLYSYATATVNGTDQVGGLIGNASGGIVMQTYASGAVHATGAAVGGFMGVGGATSQDNVYDAQATGQAHSVGDISNGEVATGRTTAQMHRASTFASWNGVDLDGTHGAGALWRLYDGGAAPLLVFWLTPLQVTVDSGTTTHVYDGTAHGDTFTDVAWTDTLAPGHVMGAPSYTSAVNAGTYTTLGGLYSDQQGYDLVITNTGSLTITPALLGATITGVSKTYDGSTSATLGTGNYVLTGFVQGEGATVTQAAGTYDSRNVVGATSVTATLGSGDYSANPGTLLGNYTLPTTATGAATITAKAITASATASDKAYDGSVAATASVGLSGIVDGDAVGSTNSASFADRNAAVGKPVNVTGIALTGADASNYALANTAATTTATITPKVITVLATGADKVYDGSVADAATLASAGVLSGDAVSFTGTGTFADKNAGAGKAVTVDAIATSGADAGNYALENTSATATATITPRAVVVSASGGDKVYDGATATHTTLTGANLVSGDDVAFSGTASFANKDAASGKTVTSSVAASGEDARNYVFNTTATSSAAITPKAITLAAAGTDKVYDGSTADAVTLQASGVLEGDTVSFSGTGQFADRNAGTGKTVAITGIAGAGADAANYAVATTGSTTASITPRQITVTLAGPVAKTSDGSTAATLGTGNYSVGNVVAGEQVLVTQTKGAYDNAADGSHKTVTVTLTGANYAAGADTLLSNYTLVDDIISGQVGVIEPSAQWLSALVSLPNLPSGIALGMAPHVQPMQRGDDPQGVQDESRAIPVVGANTRENLLKRRTFSIGDGGIRLPAGVRGSDKDASQP